MPVAQGQRGVFEPVAVGDGRTHVDQEASLHFRPKLNSPGGQLHLEIARRTEIHQQEEVRHVALAHRRHVGRRPVACRPNCSRTFSMRLCCKSRTSRGVASGNRPPPACFSCWHRSKSRPIDDHEPLDGVGQFLFGQNGVAQLRVHAVGGLLALLDAMAFVVGAKHNDLGPLLKGRR